MAAELLCASQGATLVFTISNPEFRNALGPEIYTAGIEALNVAETNPEVRSVIITGAGGMFCAGGNLNRLLASRNLPAEKQQESIDALHTWIEVIRSFPKPVIAAVEGFAAGAGFSLALACDFIVAARDSAFVMAYSKVALSPDGGGSWSLAKALPRQLATEILMLGNKITAERLHQFGVVNTLSAPGAALEQAHALADNLNAMAPTALTSVKELLFEAEGNTLNQHLREEKMHFTKNLFHPYGGEGISAFLQKRQPRFD